MCLFTKFHWNFKCIAVLAVFLLRFTPYKAEQQYQGIVLQEKEKDKDEKHIGKLFTKNPKIKRAD